MMWVLILLALLAIMLAGLVFVIESEARANGHLQPWTDNAEWTEQ